MGDSLLWVLTCNCLEFIIPVGPSIQGLLFQTRDHILLLVVVHGKVIGLSERTWIHKKETSSKKNTAIFLHLTSQALTTHSNHIYIWRREGTQRWTNWVSSGNLQSRRADLEVPTWKILVVESGIMSASGEAQISHWEQSRKVKCKGTGGLKVGSTWRWALKVWVGFNSLSLLFSLFYTWLSPFALIDSHSFRRIAKNWNNHRLKCTHILAT